MTSGSPTIRRRELGSRLRSLRLAAGLTVDEAAARMEVSPAKISRIETAARGVSVPDLRFLCELYQVPEEERERLLILAREGKRRSWWQQYGLPESVETYVGLEDAAVSIHQYETSFVPALLQTEDYARALILGTALDTSASQMEQLVQARLTRQGRLDEKESPLELWAVVDEVALLRPVGGRAVTHAQLRHLAERGDRPNLTVQVLPLEEGAHPGMNSSFILLNLEQVSDVVYVEGLVGRFFLQSVNDLARYRRAFDQLRARALSPRDSRDQIMAIADRLSP